MEARRVSRASSTSVFQLAFCMITTAIITGAVAGRMKFGAVCAFVAVWTVVVYPPLAHMVWGGEGSLVGRHHRRARLRGRRRRAHLVRPHRSHPLPHRRQAARVRPGELSSAQRAVRRAGCHASVVRLVRLQRGLRVRCRRRGGACAGQHRGRVGRGARCPGCSSSACVWASPRSWARRRAWWRALWSSRRQPASWSRGRPSSWASSCRPCCYFAISFLKRKLGYDDALDAFGCHAVGGVVGGILTGLFCVPELSWTDFGGLFYTGDPSLLGEPGAGHPRHRRVRRRRST